MMNTNTKLWIKTKETVKEGMVIITTTKNTINFDAVTGFFTETTKELCVLAKKVGEEYKETIKYEYWRVLDIIQEFNNKETITIEGNPDNWLNFKDFTDEEIIEILLEEEVY